MDGNDGGEASLVVHEDDRVMLFVPKAQTSQWELQLMPKQAVGNIVEADGAMRHALDRAILTAMRSLSILMPRLLSG
jgi:galactose-1-phosphate uridylyltransferase